MNPPPTPPQPLPVAPPPVPMNMGTVPPPPPVPPQAPAVPAEPSPELEPEGEFTQIPLSGPPVGEEDPREPLPDGTELDAYTITRKLGKGGFGITYLARHTEKGTVVVIKEHMPKGLAVREPGGSYVIPASPEQEDVLRRTMDEFTEEVTVLRGLEHPGIVPILDSFDANGTAYYVMPYVEGKALELSEKPTMDSRARRSEARTIRQQLSAMLDTLDYMEQHQVVHRDIKPENIVTTPDGRIILLDFGSARQLRPGKVFANIFTPDFCAPEQSVSKDDTEMSGRLGPWTDIYALGATFHYLISRMLPPRADMRGYAEQDPYKPLASRADLCDLYGEAFLSAIDRAMEMIPKNRWRSAADWRQSIATGLLPSNPRLMQRARIFMVTSAVLVSVFGAICLWAIRERNQAVQMYNLSLQFSEGILYDFNDELSDMPGATKLQTQLVTQLKNYLARVDKLSLASDEKLQRALASAWCDLGYVYTEQGDLEAATEALLRATGLQEELVNRNPGDSNYRYNMARIWLYRAEVARRRNLDPTATQFVSQAVEVLRELAAATPGNPDYKCALGKAMDETASLARTNGNADLYKKAIQEQLQIYGELGTQYPRNETVLTGLGHALLAAGQLEVDNGNYPSALASFERGKQIFTDLSCSNPYRLSFKKGLASVYRSMGLLHSRMGEQEPDRRKEYDEDSLQDFQNQLDLSIELAKLDPDNAEFVYMSCQTMSLMVDILVRTNRGNQAESFCRTILEKSAALLATAPDNADYAMLRADALRGLATAHGTKEFGTGQATNEFRESRDILERLLSQSPGNLPMRYMYMNVLESSARHAVEEGNVQQARRWLELAIVIMEKLVAEGPDNKALSTRLDALRKQLDELKDKQ